MVYFSAFTLCSVSKCIRQGFLYAMIYQKNYLFTTLNLLQIKKKNYPNPGDVHDCLLAHSYLDLCLFMVFLFAFHFLKLITFLIVLFQQRTVATVYLLFSNTTSLPKPPT